MALRTFARRLIPFAVTVWLTVSATACGGQAGDGDGGGGGQRPQQQQEQPQEDGGGDEGVY